MNNSGDVIAIPKDLEMQPAYLRDEYEYFAYIYDPAKQFIIACDAYAIDGHVLELHRFKDRVDQEDTELVASFNIHTHTFWMMHRSNMDIKSEYDYHMEQAGQRRKHQMLADRINEVFNPPGNTSDDN